MISAIGSDVATCHPPRHRTRLHGLGRRSRVGLTQVVSSRARRSDDPSRASALTSSRPARAPYDPKPDPLFSAALAARIERNRPVASLLLHLEVDDYDTWKPIFDSDPAGRKQSATGHTISRSVDNPTAIFIR